MVRQPLKQEIIDIVVYVLEQISLDQQLDYLIPVIIENVQNIDDYLQKHLSQDTLHSLFNLLMILVKYKKYQPSYQVYRKVCILILNQNDCNVKHKLIKFITVKLDNDFEEHLNSRIQIQENLNHMEIVYDLVVVYQQQVSSNPLILNQDNINFVFYTLQLINSVNYDQQHEILKLIKINKKEQEFFCTILIITKYIKTKSAINRIISLLEKGSIQHVVDSQVTPQLSNILIKLIEKQISPCVLQYIGRNFQVNEEYIRIFNSYYQYLRFNHGNDEMIHYYWIACLLKQILQEAQEASQYLDTISFILKQCSRSNASLESLYKEFNAGYMTPTSKIHYKQQETKDNILKYVSMILTQLDWCK